MRKPEVLGFPEVGVISSCDLPNVDALLYKLLFPVCVNATL